MAQASDNDIASVSSLTQFDTIYHELKAIEDSEVTRAASESHPYMDTMDTVDNDGVGLGTVPKLYNNTVPHYNPDEIILPPEPSTSSSSGTSHTSRKKHKDALRSTHKDQQHEYKKAKKTSYSKNAQKYNLEEFLKSIGTTVKGEADSSSGDNPDAEVEKLKNILVHSSKMSPHFGSSKLGYYQRRRDDCPRPNRRHSIPDLAAAGPLGKNLPQN